MSNQSSKKPSLYAYAVRESGNGKSFWNRIGAAWKNSDDSITIQLDALPLDGRIVCQPPKQEA